jgi:hypothetical protein
VFSRKLLLLLLLTYCCRRRRRRCRGISEEEAIFALLSEPDFCNICSIEAGNKSPPEVGEQM